MKLVISILTIDTIAIINNNLSKSLLNNSGR